MARLSAKVMNSTNSLAAAQNLMLVCFVNGNGPGVGLIRPNIQANEFHTG